jgi:hypothetical protein
MKTSSFYFSFPSLLPLSEFLSMINENHGHKSNVAFTNVKFYDVREPELRLLHFYL